jgi:cytochrome c peroxidase
MNRRWIVLASVTALVAGIAACEKEIGPAKNSTPYTLEIPMGFPQAAPPADNPLTVEGIALGRMLFYDPILSQDSTQSCSSCHNAEFGFTDFGKKYSTGIDGIEGTRNSMPISNLLWQSDFFWDGRVKRLNLQALMPIEDPIEMHETLPRVVAKLNRQPRYQEAFRAAFGTKKASAETLGLALEQFMLTFVSGNSKFDRVMRGTETFTASEQRGLQLFNGESNPNNPVRGADCFHCHGGTLFSNFTLSNNGLDSVFTDRGLGKVTGKATDDGKFKVPSLRNVAVTFPYMHDGRFQTLRQAIEHYNTDVVANSPNLDPSMVGFVNGLGLTQQDISDLIAFLETLTDESYLNNPAYASPF